MPNFVSRAGQKLHHALTAFDLHVTGKICADLGCSTGGFTDCLLQHGAAKVYAVDTGYGVLDWKLRNDARVIVMERTNAMHVRLPEKVDLVTIDVAWTRQRNILPAAMSLLNENGFIVSLIKPHYEAEPALLRGGILPVSAIPAVVEEVEAQARQIGLSLINRVNSPIKGAKGNSELLAIFQREGRELTSN
jgi:23S rRNA (cytidine1920-2'-O)/16S rRNA (cytidine1409-2'-O)-methyltransferase